VLTYFDFFTAAPPLAGLALKAAKAKRVELDVAAIEGAPLQILAGPHRALEVFSSVGRRQQAQVSEACWLFGGVLVGGILHVVWPAAACAPARGAAPEPRRRVAARRCVAGAWALRRGIVLCALTKGACGSRRAAGPAACALQPAGRRAR